MRSSSVKAFLRTTLGLVAALMIAGCASRSGQAGEAPPFSLQDMSGNTVQLSAFKGHPVMLDFWATWCAPCRFSIPMVEKFYQRHKEEGLIVIGMNMDDDTSGVFAFVKKFGMSYPIVYAAASRVPSDYGLDGIPMFVFIDKQGRVAQRYDGFSPDMPNAWEADLKSILNQK